MKQIICKECKKKYDYKFKTCPHCGYENKIKKMTSIVCNIIGIVLFIVSISSLFRYIYINNFLNEINNFMIDKTDTQFIDNVNTVIEAYQLGNWFEKYGSETYGKIAYSLNNIKIWSMCFCISLIWIGVWLKNKHTKLGNIIKYIGIAMFIIFQLLPLVFTMCVSNMRF